MFPYSSTSSANTGTECYVRVTVFVLWVLHDHSTTTDPSCALSWVHITTRYVSNTAEEWYVTPSGIYFSKTTYFKTYIMQNFNTNCTMVSEFLFTLNTFIYNDIMCHLFCKTFMLEGLQHTENYSVNADLLKIINYFYLFHVVGWFLLVSRPPIAPLYQPQITDEYGSFCGMRIGRGNWSALRKHTQCHSVHHKCHMTWPGIKTRPPLWEAGG
jgi:hypothetical protein